MLKQIIIKVAVWQHNICWNDGSKRLSCMKEPTGYSSGRKRYKGYADVCKKYGLKERIVDCCYDYESGLRAAEEILKNIQKRMA